VLTHFIFSRSSRNLNGVNIYLNKVNMAIGNRRMYRWFVGPNFIQINEVRSDAAGDDKLSGDYLFATSRKPWADP
jgi:hypothetical protein